MKKEKARKDGNKHCDLCALNETPCAKVYTKMGDPNDISTKCINDF